MRHCADNPVGTDAVVGALHYLLHVLFAHGMVNANDCGASLLQQVEHGYCLVHTQTPGYGVETQACHPLEITGGDRGNLHALAAAAHVEFLAGFLENFFIKQGIA